MEYDIKNEPDEKLINLYFKQHSDKNYYYDLSKIKHTEYYFTQKALDNVEKYGKTHEISNTHEETYIKYIIDIYNSKKHIVIASKYSLWNVIRTMLLLYFNPIENQETGKKSESIALEFDKIIDIRCKLLGIVKLHKKTNVQAQFKKIKDTFLTAKQQTKKQPIKKLQTIKKEGSIIKEESPIYPDSDETDDESIQKRPTPKPPTKKKSSTKKDSKKSPVNNQQTQISMADKHKIINKTISIYIKNNLKRRKDDYVPLSKVFTHFKESSEFKESSLKDTDIKRSKFYAWFDKYKWFTENYKEKYKNIRNVLVNYNLEV